MAFDWIALSFRLGLRVTTRTRPAYAPLNQTRKGIEWDKASLIYAESAAPVRAFGVANVRHALVGLLAY
jgi:hypothetical protein